MLLRGGAWHSYTCGQTVGWIKMPLGKDLGLGPGRIMLHGDPVGTQPPTTAAAPPHFRPMPIVAKRLLISATDEHLLRVQLSTWMTLFSLVRISRSIINISRCYFRNLEMLIYEWNEKVLLCKRWKDEVKYIGHVLSKDGIRIDPSKTDVIPSWPRPKTAKQTVPFWPWANFTNVWRVLCINQISAPCAVLGKPG